MNEASNDFSASRQGIQTIKMRLEYRGLDQLVLLDFSLTVKLPSHECVIRTGQP